MSTNPEEPTATMPAADSAPTTETTIPVTPPSSSPLARRRVRMRTVVLGVVLLAVAVLSLIDVTTSINLDLGTAVLVVMIGCGVLLIAGARRE